MHHHLLHLRPIFLFRSFIYRLVCCGIHLICPNSINAGDLRTVAVLAAIIAFLVEAAFAENINVGSPNGGWDEETDLGSWSSSRTFIVGDNLIFQYSSMHDVLEVTKANFDSCQASSPLKSYNGGKTVILLDSPGKRYFICGTAGHCDRGMKLEVNLVAPASSSPSSPATSPPKKAASPVMSPPPSSKEASPTVSPSESPRDGSAASSPASGSPLSPLTPPSTQGFAPAPASSKAAGGFFPNKIVVIGFGLFTFMGF